MRRAVLALAAVLLVFGCLIGVVLVRGAADNGRSEGEAALAAITLPDGWTRTKVQYRETRPDGAYPTVWSVRITAPAPTAAAQQDFVDAMRAAGWQQCGDGVTCWVKRPYRLSVRIEEHQTTTDYAIEMKRL